MKLNVGCGRNIMEGWVNVDSMALPGVDVVMDLDAFAHDGDACPRYTGAIDRDRWEMPTYESVDEYLLSHVIEHLRNPLPLMAKLWWLAKPNALMTVRCPHGASDDADEDPTHVRRMFPGSFGYFSQPYYWRADYGYRGDWQVETIQMRPAHDYAGTSDQHLLRLSRTLRNVIDEMVVTLRAIKPRRPPLRDLQVYIKPTYIK